MKINPIFVLFIVVSLVLLITQVSNRDEGFISVSQGRMAQPALSELKPSQNFNHLLTQYFDVSEVLKKTTFKGKKAYRNTKGLGADIAAPANCCKFSDQKKAYIPKGHRIWSKIRDYQHPVIDYPDNTAKVRRTRRHPGRLYHHDWRFPREQVDVRFIDNPTKYCKQYPYRYPCYVIGQKFWDRDY